MNLLIQRTYYLQSNLPKADKGPSIAVRLQEVSAYRSLKNTNTLGAEGVMVMPSNH